MSRMFFTLLLCAFTFFSQAALAEDFTLKSTDISQGAYLGKDHEYQGFGCDGGNKSPQLSWSGVPEGTKAYAIMVYDLDAPTGSGWWHWQVVNIPLDVNALETGAASTDERLTADGVITVKNDYGSAGFGGVCPPIGHGAHRYQFTIHALSKVLELPEDPSGALTGYMVHANSLGSSTIEALYKRD